MDHSTQYTDQKACLEAIGQFLASNVPEPWLWIRADVQLLSAGAITTSSFQPVDQSKEPEHFIIEDATTDMEFMRCFQQLARLLSTEEKRTIQEMPLCPGKQREVSR